MLRVLPHFIRTAVLPGSVGKQKVPGLVNTAELGQIVESPLSVFLNTDAQAEHNHTDGHQLSDQSSLTMQALPLPAMAPELPKEQLALVAQLLDGVSELAIEKEQQVAFTPVIQSHAIGIDVPDRTFVASADIVKLVSTGTTVWTKVGLQLVETTVLLLNNGMAYTNLTSSPDELKLPTSLVSTESDMWTTWRQDDTGAIYLGVSGSSTEARLVGDEITVTPLSNADIAGTHSKVTAETWGASQITKWSDVTFSEDGTFEFAVSELTTTGGTGSILVDTLTSSFRHLSANKSSVSVSNQTELSAPGEVINIGTGKADTTGNTNMFGTYTLSDNGLSIELSFADGRVEKRLIYKTDRYVHFGKSSYSTQDNANSRLSFLRGLARDMVNEGRTDWLTVLADSTAAAGQPGARSHAPTINSSAVEGHSSE